MDENVERLAIETRKRGILPEKASADVSHIAVSAVHQIDFLLTLNCKHIANPFIAKRIANVCEDIGYELPVICTPRELLQKES